mgnify:CR=1 FL=1
MLYREHPEQAIVAVDRLHDPVDAKRMLLPGLILPPPLKSKAPSDLGKMARLGPRGLPSVDVRGASPSLIIFCSDFFMGKVCFLGNIN